MSLISRSTDSLRSRGASRSRSDSEEGPRRHLDEDSDNEGSVVLEAEVEADAPSEPMYAYEYTNDELQAVNAEDHPAAFEDAIPEPSGPAEEELVAVHKKIKMKKWKKGKKEVPPPAEEPAPFAPFKF